MMQIFRPCQSQYLDAPIVDAVDGGAATLRTTGETFQTTLVALADGRRERLVQDEFGRVLRILRPSDVVDA